MEKLVDLPLFKGLKPEELEKSLAQIIYQRKTCTKDGLIATQGEPCNRLIIIMKGMAKAEMTDPTGKSLKIEDFQPPVALASAFLFGSHANFPVNVLASTDVEYIQIPRPELLRLFQTNQHILQNFLSMISSRAQFLSEKLRFHSFKSLKAKVAYFIMNEAQNRTKFKLSHSQNDLAELFGVARPSVGRIFMQLQEENIIDVRYKEVTIKDIQKLSNIFRD